MTTRRDIITSGLGLAGIIAAGKAPAAFVRSMVAARSAAMGKSGGGGWVNPYITDGLMAMWDGINNVAMGDDSHDDHARSWIDLIGGIGLENVSSGASLSWDHNCYISTNSFGITNAQYDASLSSRVNYLEVCFSDFIHGNYSLLVGLLSSVENPTSYYAGLQLIGNGFGAIYGVVSTDVESESGTVCLSFKKNDGLQRTTKSVYKDSSELQLSSRSDFYNSNGCRGVAISPRTGYPFVAKVHSLRLYEQELSLSDIAHNYAIDKARFNLP